MTAAEIAMIQIVAAMIATTLLLAFGAAAGYWAGAARYAPLLAHMEGCIDSGERTAKYGEVVSALAQADDRLPEAMSIAIQRMVVSTSELGARLRQLRSMANLPSHSSEAEDAVDLAEQPIRQLTPPPSPVVAPDRLRDPKLPASADQTLTTEEMSEAVGGRHRLGDSTLGLESKRYPYDCLQRAVPWSEGEPFPAPHRIETVRCHDISVSGISFFWPDEPGFSKVVISIGSGEKQVFMVAEVRQHKAVYKHQQVAYLVGCQFVRRLEDLTAEWNKRDRVVGVEQGSPVRERLPATATLRAN